jgi:hypothetical protein
MKKIILLASIVLCFSAVSFAQPRTIEKVEKKREAKDENKAPAPNSFTAKYEGGMFGFDKSETGTLRFDDANERIVFFNKAQKEQFAVPYTAMLMVYPQSRSMRSTAGTVVSAIPLPGAGLAGLIRSKKSYLVVNFSDPEVDVKGIVSFKLENKDLLGRVINTLGEKAKLTPRGGAFYRVKPVPKNQM